MRSDFEFSPVDVNIRTKHVCVNTILERLRNDEIDYDEEGSIIDVRVLEFMLLMTPFFMVVRPNHATEKIEVYLGGGIVRTLKYYILEDNEIGGMTTLPELNGKKFSEIPMYYQRRIKETMVMVVVDGSFFKGPNVVIEEYCDMFNNIR